MFQSQPPESKPKKESEDSVEKKDHSSDQLPLGSGKIISFLINVNVNCNNYTLVSIF